MNKTVVMAKEGHEAVLELALLRNYISEAVKSNETDPGDVLSCVTLILEGRFQKVVEIAESLKIVDLTDCDVETHQWLPNVVNFIGEKDDGQQNRKLLVLCVAVACLQLFVQNNWVGPLTDESPISDKQAAVLGRLSVDGEVVLSAVRHPVYLWIAEGLLLDCRQELQTCWSLDWWLMRCLQTHQGVIDQRSPTLKATIVELIDNIKKSDITSNEDYRDLAIEFLLEAGHLFYFFYEPKEAHECMNRAEELSGLTIGLTGELGKRTRYQQKELAQLVLQVTSQTTEDRPLWSHPEERSTPLPKNLALDDDTVLDKIQLSDESTELVCDLTAVQQALILGLCYRHRKSREAGKIIQEECLAYVNGALSKPRAWSVQTAALVMRSSWECEDMRQQQRSMSQLEELVSQSNRPEPDARYRLPHLFCSKLPSLWEIQRELALLLERVGAMNAALEIYQRLQAWEDVIKCYAHLGKKAKADQLIREQLAIAETPLLWCYLGDIHDDEAHYQKAWELSGGRFSRAQRSLGVLYLRNKEYEKSVVCFDKALQINSLQIGTWFTYGCAAMSCQQYDVAAKAFRRCVNLDSDNYEAWSNLATSYIRLKQKSRAFTVLQEALKCEFENWRLWDNYLVLSVDVGEFEESIRAYHRMLDLKDKHKDLEVLLVLVRAVKENLQDAHDHPAGRLRSKALELFGRITSKITTDADIWRMYADLVSSGDEPITETDRQKALQYRQKSHRCTTQTPAWERDIQKSAETLRQSDDMAKAYLEFSNNTSDATQGRQMLGAARLMIKGVLAKVKVHTDPVSGELAADLQEPYNVLEERLATIVHQLQK